MYHFIILILTVLLIEDKGVRGQDSCHLQSQGRNDYFILEPGYQLVLEGSEGKKKGRLIVTVLQETKSINGTETRIVEEKEWENGELVEISRNYFAICPATRTVYYFGEEVDIYENGRITGHEGAWLAEGKNRAGIIMPGNPSIGQNYFQELAPGIAMDQMKILSVSEKIRTPAGYFENVLKSEETNSLEPGEKEYKFYAPGVGLIRDEYLRLVKYGFVK